VNLPHHAGELSVERKLGALAQKNVPASSVPFFVGAGAYKHHVPATVDHLIQRSEFLTSYTPDQPEIAQGTLQYLFEFQTQVALLTGMEVANASMYDGSTGTGEAVLMAHRVTKRRKAVLSGGLHPQYADVVKTLSAMAGDAVVAAPADVTGTEDLAGLIDSETSCIVVQNPDVFGNIRDLRPLAAAAQARGALLIAVFTEALSLGLIELAQRHHHPIGPQLHRKLAFPHGFRREPRTAVTTAQQQQRREHERDQDLFQAKTHLMTVQLRGMLTPTSCLGTPCIPC
jgi:glycine dehydrogenase subunit 1